MSQINLSDYNETEQRILKGCFNEDGTLKMSKPKIDDTYMSRWTAYVWRQLVFQLSTRRRHQCRPVLCFYELGQHNREEVIKALNALVKKVTEKIPLEEQPGLWRWL